MTSTQVFSAVVAIVLAGLIIVRQVRPRPVAMRGLVVLPLVLIVIGVSTVAKAAPKGQSMTSAETTWLAVDLALGVVSGVARGFTVRLYEQAGELWRRGTRLTVILWLVTIALRVVISVVGSKHGAARVLNDGVLLTLGVSLGAQYGLVWWRGTQSGIPFAVRDRGQLGP
jgi:hypothetical protein